MADKPQNKYLFPGLSYILNSNNMMLNQSNANLSHFSNMNSDHSPMSSINSLSDKGPRKPNNFGKIVIMGALASGIYTLVAPIQRVYTLMQCQNELVQTGRLSRPYKGMTDCFRRTIKYEGFCSLWRGNSVNLFTVCLTQGMALASSKHPQNDHNHEPPTGAKSAALLMFANLFCYPIAYAKVRLLNDVTDASGRWHHSLDLSGKTQITYATNRLFSGAFDVVRKTLVSDGIYGIYRGYTITCLGIYVYYHADRAAKDVVSKYSSEKKSQVMTVISPGIVSGISMLSLHALVYPVGTVSRRMMLRSGEANKYKGSIDALTQIVRKEGVGALYKGLTPHLMYHLVKASIISTVLYASAKLGILMSRNDLKV